MCRPLHSRKDCRLCNSLNLELAVVMKATPIADAFISAKNLGSAQDVYPLDLYLCRECGHVQNIDVVNSELLFVDYFFKTSNSKDLVGHFSRYASKIISDFNISPKSMVVEMGSNDGSLLKFFKESGMRVLGVDPAVDIAKEATEAGIETIPEFFNVKLANKIREDYGGASVFCANNVFAHIDNLAEIVIGVYDVLLADGVFVFEVSYLVDIVDNLLFDTVYHEHVSYHSIIPLVRFLNANKMQLIDVQRIPSKGGSIRCYAQKLSVGNRSVQASVGDLLKMEKERGFDQLTIYHNYSVQIDKYKTKLNSFLDKEIRAGKMIAGYGASTTTTTLIWNFELTRKLSFIMDDNLVKHGLYSPGCHIPVVPSDEMYVRKPDYVVILAWQYVDLIVNRHKEFIKEGGVFIVPLPEFKIISI